jgi:four helix bundle protein
LTSLIYEVTDEERFARDIGLREQIRRASVSILSNLAEGFERGRPAEFPPFLSFAKASCAELRSQLYIALDAGYLEEQTCKSLMSKAKELEQVIADLRACVQKRLDDF